MNYHEYDAALLSLRRRGNLQELIALCRHIVEKFRVHFGEVHEQTAKAVQGLAFAYYDAGDCDSAAEEWSKVCEIHRVLFGERSCQYVRALSDVARARLLGGHTEEAEKLIEHAAAVLQSLPGDHRMILIETSVLLAKIRLRQRATDDAERILLQAARIRLRQLDEEYGGYNWIDQCLSNIYCHLGLVLAHQNRLRAAKGAMLKAIRIHEKDMDNVYPYHARNLSTLGAIQQKLGDFAGAKASQHVALDILRTIRPAGHFDIAIVERRLAELENCQALSVNQSSLEK